MRQLSRACFQFAHALGGQQPQSLSVLFVVMPLGFVLGWRPSLGLQGEDETRRVDSEKEQEQVSVKSARRVDVGSHLHRLQFCLNQPHRRR